jgi:hypothetical protein
VSACSRYAEQFRSASGYRRRRARDSTGCRSGALRRHDVRKIVRTCRVCCHVRAYMFTNALLAVPKTPISSAFPCARVDSNHHGENSPQGPQPHSRVPYASARVQIVSFVRDRGRIGHIGRNDLGQRWATHKLCQVDPSRYRASQCRTRVRAEHLFDRVVTRPSSVGSEAAHRQSPACHNDRREAEAGGSTTPWRRGWSDSIQRWSRLKPSTSTTLTLVVDLQQRLRLMSRRLG